MGNTATSPVQPVLNQIKLWNLSRALATIKSYKEGDFDFGVDALALAALTGLDEDKARALVKIHSRNSTGLVNALVVLATLVCFAESEAPNEVIRSGALFDIVDFAGASTISTDEFAILILTVVTSIALATEQTSVLPSDTDIMKYSKDVLESLGKKASSQNSAHAVHISRDEFVNWTKAEFFSRDINNINSIFNRILSYIERTN